MDKVMVTIHLKYIIWLVAYTFTMTVAFIKCLWDDSTERNKYQQEIIKYFRKK